MRQRILLFTLSLLFLAACKTGTVTGTVTFKGAPCPPGANKVPPCQGPYPAYEVSIMQDGSESVVATVFTDEDGIYKAKLKPGSYQILAQAGIEPEITKAYKFTIEKGKKMLVDVMVSTGIQ